MHIASPKGLQSASATKISKVKMLSPKKEKEAKKRKRHIEIITDKKRINNIWLTSSVNKENYKVIPYFCHNQKIGEDLYMNKNLVEDIVSDCGYQALGLYEYLYCNKDEKYNVTVISMYQMVNIGDYHNEDTLVESIEDLKEFGYLEVVDNIYLFPRSTENYNAFFELLEVVGKIESPNELATLNNEDMQLILKIYDSKKEDIEMGYSD